MDVVFMGTASSLFQDAISLCECDKAVIDLLLMIDMAPIATKLYSNESPTEKD